MEQMKNKKNRSIPPPPQLDLVQKSLVNLQLIPSVLLQAFYRLFPSPLVMLLFSRLRQTRARASDSPLFAGWCELGKVHAGGKPRLEAGKWRCQEVGCTSLTHRPFFFLLFNFLAPSHQIEESGGGESQRMFILQANSLFMVILTSQGSCKRVRIFFFFGHKKVYILTEALTKH